MFPRRAGAPAIWMLLAWSATCSAALLQKNVAVVSFMDVESYKQRSLLQSLVALDSTPSSGSTEAPANSGPMGGTGPATSTGPSGLSGPTTGASGADDATPSMAAAGVDLLEVTQRRTMGGLRCRLPVVYGGQLYTNCMQVGGIERCSVRAHDALQKCAPTTAPKVTALPAMLAAGLGADGGNGSLCGLGSTDFSLQKCATAYACISMVMGPLAGSGYGYCGNPADAPQDINPPPRDVTTTPEPLAAAPVADYTVGATGEDVAAATPAADESTIPAEAISETAQPPTTGGLTSTEAETLLEPQDVNPLAGVFIPKRVTMRGTTCRLPVVYKGFLMEDCQPLDRSGQLQCFIRGLRYVANCSKVPDYTTDSLLAMLTAGTAGDGQEGAVCSLSGDASSGPACADGLTCVVLPAYPLADTDIGYCKKDVALAPTASVTKSVVQVDAAAAPAPLDDATQAAVDALAPTVDASAADQSGQAVDDGTATAEAPSPGGIPAMAVAQRVTVTGDKCRLPLVFGSNLLLDCLPMSSSDAPPQCFTIGISVPQQCDKSQPWASHSVTELLALHNGTDGYTGSLCNVDAGKANDTAVTVAGTCRFGLTCKPLAGALTGSGIGYCAMAAATNITNPDDYRVTRRSSIDGTPCRLPLIQGGNLLLDCVSMNSSIPMCVVSGNPVDAPRPCSPAQPGTRVRLGDLIQAAQGMDGAEGSLCTQIADRPPAVTPPWNGAVLKGCNPGLVCSAIGGPFNGTDYGYCKKVVAPAPAAAPGVMDVATTRLAIRTTTLGARCRIPIFYKGELLIDCKPLEVGVTAEQCFVANVAEAQTCAPTPPGGRTLVPLSSWFKVPKIPDGLLGAPCRIPIAPATSSECTAGLMCTAVPDGIINAPGIGYCVTGDGVEEAMVPPAVPPAAAATLDQMLVSSRSTVTGVQCRLPIYYKGQLMLDCMPSDTGSFCFTRALAETAPCAPKQVWASDAPLGQQLQAGLGLDGQEGALCLLVPVNPTSTAVCLKGLQCMPATTRELAASGYGYCAALTGAGSDVMSSVLVSQRVTASGELCRLPVVYQGSLMRDCMLLDGGEQPACFTGGLADPVVCSDEAPAQTMTLTAMLGAGKGADGNEGSLCLPRGSTAARSASAMLPCAPALTCISYPALDAELGPGYGYCGSNASTGVVGRGTDFIVVNPRSTTTGYACRLPVVFKGELHTDCIKEQGMELCFTTGLESTAACSPDPFPNVTLSSLIGSGRASDGGAGALCLLAPPPTANAMPCANPDYTCTKLTGGPLEGSSYGYCALGGGNATSLSGASLYLSTLQVSNRQTVDGAQCRLPVVHLGQLYTDCMHINDVLRCYVLGSGEAPRDCAPLNASEPTLSAAALLARNASADGLEGSLCTLGTLGASNGDVLPCATGLSCHQLDGPLASAGYGYCEVGLDSLGAAQSAGSLYVAPPVSGTRGCGPRCVGGALLGSVVALVAVTGAAYLWLKRKGKGRGAQPFGGAFSRFNNAPTGVRPISNLDAAVNGSLSRSGSSARTGGLGALAPEGHVSPSPFATPFPPGKPGPANGHGGPAPIGSVGGLSISRQASAASAISRQPSAALSTWAKSRQGSLISPTFLDQYVAPDAGKGPGSPEQQEKNV